MSTPREVLDLAPATETFLEDVLQGLGASPKTLPCKYFYDEEGSRLFDQICELEEYYPTRTELAIMDRYVPEMAAVLGPRCLVAELGSGSGRKTEVLLAALEAPVAYVPIEIACEQLEASAARLAERFPELRILPVCADYMAEVELPPEPPGVARRVVYFPGSTLGNLDREQAVEFLRRIAGWVGPGGGLLIGVDLDKDPAVLEAAYNDARGVTAAFNLNLLARINRELSADFDVGQFRHRAHYDREKRRIEMHLESLVPQEVRVGEEVFRFTRGETICTEHSNKYRLEGFREMSERAGFAVERVWTDDARLFSVQALRA